MPEKPPPNKCEKIKDAYKDELEAVQKYDKLLDALPPDQAKRVAEIIGDELRHSQAFAEIAQQNACSLNGNRNGTKPPPSWLKPREINWDEVDKVENQIKELSNVLTTPSFLLPEVRAELIRRLETLKDRQYFLIMGETRPTEEKLEM